MSESRLTESRPPESRLAEALNAVAATVAPHDVPPLVLPPRRRAVRPALVAATGIVLTAAAAIAVFLAFAQPQRGPVYNGPVGAPAEVRGQVQIYLCVPQSINPNCNHSATTTMQREMIRNRLRTLPGVMVLTYVPRGRTQVENRPDAYFVTCATLHFADGVIRGVVNMPGVDQIVGPRPA